MLLALLHTPVNVHCVGSSNKTALHSACCLGDVRLVKILLKHGASIEDFIDTNGPLHAIVFNCWNQEIKDIILRDNLNYRDRRGNTVVHHAIKNNDVILLESLLRMGASPNTPNTLGETPLHFLLSVGDFRTAIGRSMFELLIHSKADINCKSMYGGTALHLACQNNIDYYLRRLLFLGADMSVVSCSKTPLELAAHKHCSRSVQLLLAYGAEKDQLLKVSANHMLSEKLITYIAEHLIALDTADLEYDAQVISKIKETVEKSQSKIELTASEHSILRILEEKHNEKSLTIRRKCSNEIELMKSVTLMDTDITVYEFLHYARLELQGLSEWIHNDVEHIITPTMLSNFPIYSGTLKRNIDILKGYLLYNDVSDGLHKVSWQRNPVPDLICYNICNYLSIADMENFKSAMQF